LNNALNAVTEQRMETVKAGRNFIVPENMSKQVRFDALFYLFMEERKREKGEKPRSLSEMLHKLSAIYGVTYNPVERTIKYNVI
jgi:hypothetical protein